MATSPTSPQANPNPAPRWVPLLRNFEKEQQTGTLKREEVADGLDPLSKLSTPAVASPAVTKQVSSTNLTDNNTKTTPSTPKVVSNPLSDDPLSASSVNDPLSDPLSSAASDPLSSSVAKPVQKSSSSTAVTSSSSSSNESKVKVEDDLINTFVPWKAKKATILSEFTTDETLGVTVSFIEGADSSGKVQAPVDRTQQRLAQIEQSEEYTTKQTLQMNQKEWEKHIEKLHEDLITAWNGEERVKSLKIAIQCAKLLGDISVIKFYPSKYVMITEILDTFGRLVYERIANKDGETKGKKLVVPDLITEQARETCRNWFYKIASIRELLPRLYVEMAIIRCYEFIQHNTFPIVINRIASQLRGLGDPLIALYARSYLARKGYEVAPDLKDYLLNCLQDFVASLQTLKAPKFLTDLTNYHITAPEYHHIFEPALDWVLQCIGHNAGSSVFDNVLSFYRNSNNPVLLKHIISSFKPTFISANARLFAGLIRDAEDVLPKYQLYTALGVNLVLAPPPKEEQLGILNEVWKVITKWEDVKEYVTVTEVFIEYPLKYFSPKEVNVMLGDLLRHIKENSAFEKFQPQLHSIVQKVVANSPNFSKMFAMENFIALLDLFTGETQNEVNKSILSAFAKNADVTSDPVIIQAMINIGKAVHDSVNSLSFQDEIRQISKGLISFIHKVDFGMDLEKHLNFFVECRRSFGNFDSVKYNLVVGACNLAMRTLAIVKGKHTKKTSTFVRACIGFCFITIPSMDDYFGRLNLNLLAGQVALQNQALPQADSFFKSAIKLIQEVPAKIDNVPTEENLIQFISAFCSLLIAVPGHPEQGPFYLVKGLLKVVGEYPWDKVSGAKGRVFLNMLTLFANYAQPKFPYRFKGVDSNDVLYGADPDYLGEIQAIINKVLDDILEEIAKLKSEEAESSEAVIKQGKLALDLFNYTLSFAELTPKSATLAVKLFELAKPVADKTYLKNSLDYLRNKEGNLAKELLKKLVGS